MGFMNFFSTPSAPELLRLPSGSFTVDRDGEVIASTLPGTFPPPLVAQIGRAVLSTFHSAHEANWPQRELMIEYGALKLTARELRGGAIIFLAPGA
jgi:hypothetical protein